jgi:hypothetical protein
MNDTPEIDLVEIGDIMRFVNKMEFHNSARLGSKCKLLEITNNKYFPKEKYGKYHCWVEFCHSKRKDWVFSNQIEKYTKKARKRNEPN